MEKKTIEVHEYLLFSWWGPALVNGDMSGYNEDEIAEIEDWLQINAPGNCVEMRDDEHFAYMNDASPLGGMVSTFVFIPEN